MKTRDAIAIASRAFQLEPHEPSGFAFFEGVVVISSSGGKESIVIHRSGDAERLMGVLLAFIASQEVV